MSFRLSSKKVPSPYFFKPMYIMRREILRTTPIGMSIDDVVRVLRSDNKWRDLTPYIFTGSDNETQVEKLKKQPSQKA